jgi:hypothetical protein
MKKDTLTVMNALELPRQGPVCIARLGVGMRAP